MSTPTELKCCVCGLPFAVVPDNSVFRPALGNLPGVCVLPDVEGVKGTLFGVRCDVCQYQWARNNPPKIMTRGGLMGLLGDIIQPPPPDEDDYTTDEEDNDEEK